MYEKIKQLLEEKPLLMIIIIALIPRIIAVIFAKGYGMYDDHFVFIEQPFRILNDHAIWEGRNFPQGRSVIYPSLHYYFFMFLNSIGVHDPQVKMFFVRFIHAIYSLLIVYFGYKITNVISGKELANKVGLILALFWLLPFMSVRNLNEMVCIPPLMGGLYYAVKEGNKTKWFIAGILFGLAFVFRVQTLLLPGGVGLVLLFRKQFSEMFLLTIGCMLSMFLVQGLADWAVWGYPFASFTAYFIYNATHSTDYCTGPWYRYILLMIGILIPPVSLFLLYGFLRTWKKYLILFLPVFLFFVFHSYFPNKQERFILPILPFLVILGIVGWNELEKKSKFWINHFKLRKALWTWFWVLNTILLLIFSFTYSKKSRVESMYYFNDHNTVNAILVVGGNTGNNHPPTFYMNRYDIPVYTVYEKYTNEEIEGIKSREISPNYVLFFGNDNLEDRLIKLEKSLDLTMKLEKEINPSFLDDILHTLNPRGNKNQTGYIYEVKSRYKNADD